VSTCKILLPPHEGKVKAIPSHGRLFFVHLLRDPLVELGVLDPPVAVSAANAESSWYRSALEQSINHVAANTQFICHVIDRHKPTMIL